MSIFVYLDGALVGTSSIRLNSEGNQAIGGLPSAADGTGSQGNIVFDDPTGSLSVTGWQIVQVREPDCTTAPVLFYGTVADRTYRRGPYVLGAGREIDTTINDHNGFLSLRLLGGDDPSRPEETDIARLNWLLSDESLEGLVYDLGFVQGTGLTFDAANLQGMYPSEVLADLASRYGQIFFTYWDQAAQKVGLFFDFPTATTFTSTLSISNDLSDITLDANKEPTGTVYPPHIDGELVADPSEVYSRVRFKYAGGAVWRSNAVTAATFFPPPLDYRSVQVENDRVGKRTTAITFADRILASDSVERFLLRFTVRLPSTKVGLIQAGMRIFLRFTHLPDFETGAYTRIERINVIPVDGDPTHYDVSCECSVGGLTTATGTGGGSTDPFPHDPTPGTPAHYASGHVDAFSEGCGSSGGAAVLVPVATNTTSLVQGDSQVTLVNGISYNYHFQLILNAADLDTGHEAGLVAVGNPAIWSSPHLSTGPGLTTTLYEGSFTVGGATGDYYVDFSAAGAGHVAKAMAVDWWIDPVDWDTGDDPDVPSPGNPIEDETPTPDPDGVEDTFTTANPFASLSLHVTVNGAELDSGVDFTETTSTTFTFTRPPLADAQIVVWYIAA